jgi:hypothetical protein
MAAAQASALADGRPDVSAAVGLGGLRVPVVRCSTPPTESGFPPQFRRSGFPRRGPAVVGARLASQLALYSNGWLTLLAPRGWKCRAVLAATGHVFLSVLPPGAPAQVVSVSRRTPAVTADLPSAGTGEFGGLACPFFPAAAPQPGWTHCPSIPTGELVTRLGSHVAAFEDPSRVAGTGDPSGGVYPANGVVVYRDTRAALATCTLTEAKHAECTAILNDFIGRYPL